jgi:hypothetical protein
VTRGRLIDPAEHALSALRRGWAAATPTTRRRFLTELLDDAAVVALIDELRGRVAGTQA